jgi:hypothetical protein
MDVAQVEARLAETTLDVVFVRPGERYWIGSRPGVQLAIAVAGAFPIVTGGPDGFTVRAPIGVPLVVNGKPTAAVELRLAAGVVCRLELGLATVTIRLVAEARAPVPRPLVDRRPAAYLGASLLAHLCVWAIALAFAAPPRAKLHRPRLVSIGAPNRPPPRAEPPTAAPPSEHAKRSAADVQVAPNMSDVSAVRASHHLGSHEPQEPIAAFASGASELAAVLDQINVVGALDQVGPVYRPEEVQTFGGQHAFDPQTRPGFAAVPTGAYATIDRGHGAGDDYEPAGWRAPKLALCATARCQIDGELTGEQMRAALDAQLEPLAACGGHARHGEIVLDLDIDASGKVRAIRGHGHGLGDVARCAAKIVASVEFPAADAATHAQYPIGY